MKIQLKLYLLIAYSILICHGASLAQLTMPSNFLSGSLNFDTEKYDSKITDIYTYQNNSTNIYSGVSWGHYFNQHWIVGISLGLESNYQRTFNGGLLQTETISKSRLISISLFTRYIRTIAENWYVFPRLSVGTGFGKTHIEQNKIDQTTYTSNQYNVMLGLGIGYQFHKHWSVEVMPVNFGYRYIKKPATQTSEANDTTSKFYINSFTDGLSLSFNYLF